MGVNGPIPKRSEERIRRNKDEDGPELLILPVNGPVDVPELGLENPHPMVEDFWKGLVDSAHSRYYEPSDWQFARWTLHWMNDQLRASKPSAVLIQTINGALSDLLVTEGDRRRVRLEIERNPAGPDGKPKEASVSDIFRERFAQ